jgi:putative resolvase
MNAVPVLISASRVAEMLDVHPNTVVIWAKEGKIKAIRLPSGRFRFRLEDIEAILSGAPA